MLEPRLLLSTASVPVAVPVQANGPWQDALGADVVEGLEIDPGGGDDLLTGGEAKSGWDLVGTGASYFGWNYVSWTHGELPESTRFVKQTWEGSHGLTDLRIVRCDPSPGGTGCLRADADLFASPDPAERIDGEIFVDVRYRPSHTEDEVEGPVVCGARVRDFSDALVTITAKMAASLLGPSWARNGMQAFVKSFDEGTGNWCGAYGTWQNGTGGWQEMVLDLAGPLPPTWGHVDPGFDPSKIALVGFKIGTSTANTGPFQGQVDIAGVRVDFSDGGFWEFDFEDLDGSIARMASTGANCVAIVDTWYMDSREGTEITCDQAKTQQFPGSPPGVEDTVVALHDAGLQAIIKPHLDITDPNPDDAEDPPWRGRIRPADADLPAFFDSYKQFISFYAGIAERTHAEALVVETELEYLCSPSDPAEINTLRPFWEDVFDSVRQIYSGDLLIASNWNSQSANEGFQNLIIADLVDCVGIDAYLPVSGAPDPTLGEMITSFETWREEIRTWQQATGKPYCFTEIGISSRDGAAAEPWGVCGDGQTAYYNDQIQVRYYEAALNVFQGEQGFCGLLGWHFWPWADAGGPGDVGFTPQNKALENESGRLFPPPKAELRVFPGGLGGVVPENEAGVLEVIFTKPVQDVTASDVSLTEDDLGAITPDRVELSPDRRVARFVFNGGLPAREHWNTYTLTVHDSVLDLPGNALDGDRDGNAGGEYVRKFSVLMLGDANGDGQVGIADLSALADNYGAADAGWSRGDFNGDGAVGIADLSALADNYGRDITGGGRTPELPPAEYDGRAEQPAAESVMPPESLAALAQWLAGQTGPADARGTGPVDRNVTPGGKACTLAVPMIRVVLPAPVGRDPGSAGRSGELPRPATPIDGWTDSDPVALADSSDLLAGPHLSVLPVTVI